MRQIVLDTETTGLNMEEDRIVEIGCVEIIDRKINTHYFHEYINPERACDADAEKIHGLTAEFLADKPVFAKIAGAFCDYIRGAEVIMHNAAFDVGFLNAELKRMQMPAVEELAAAVTDTLAMARKRFPGRRNTLDILCDRFGVNRTRRVIHGALLDAQLLAEVFLAMTRGQETLAISRQADEAGTQAVKDAMPSLAHFPIRVLQPSEDDLKKHEAVLDDIEKSNKGAPCIWRQSGKAAAH